MDKYKAARDRISKAVTELNEALKAANDLSMEVSVNSFPEVVIGRRDCYRVQFEAFAPIDD